MYIIYHILVVYIQSPASHLQAEPRYPPRIPTSSKNYDFCQFCLFIFIYSVHFRLYSVQQKFDAVLSPVVAMLDIVYLGGCYPEFKTRSGYIIPYILKYRNYSTVQYMRGRRTGHIPSLCPFFCFRSQEEGAGVVPSPSFFGRRML